jgi:hypothetical protein
MLVRDHALKTSMADLAKSPGMMDKLVPDNCVWDTPFYQIFFGHGTYIWLSPQRHKISFLSIVVFQP